jgi:hypothetical protein
VRELDVAGFVVPRELDRDDVIETRGPLVRELDLGIDR